MAQWARQFTGNTHETKVEDIQKTLSKAVISFKSSSDSEKNKKGKSVIHLAGRLLLARKKMLKVRISKLRKSTPPDEAENKLQSLVDRQTRLSEGGVTGILSEYDVDELAVTLNESV